jgi:hypothetical protein
MASEQTRMEYSLVETQEKLNFYKRRLNQDESSKLLKKWVEIYTERLEIIKSKLGKTD